MHNPLDEDRLLFWLSVGYFLVAGLLVLLALLFFTPASSAAEPERLWTGIVVHHSESSCETTVEDIDHWHKERGWAGIGYHFVIDCEGIVHDGRSLSIAGAHARGRNSDHIGICLIGRESFSGAQQESLRSLIAQLAVTFPIVQIERHHERCPGPGIAVEQLRGRAQLAMAGRK